jgi:hypothetical protein
MNKKNWLRGGIISVIFMGVVTLVFLVLFPTQPNQMISAASVPVLIGFEYPVGVIFELLKINTHFFWTSATGSNCMILISIIDYFIVGAIIGGLYGKIKNRRSV